MLTDKTVAVIANLIIGACFLWVMVWVMWLYARCHTPWRYAWFLIIVSIVFTSAGLSRLAHTMVGMQMATVAVPEAFDIILAGGLTVMAGIVPFIVCGLRRLPTPCEYQQIRVDASGKKDSDTALMLERRRRQLVEASREKVQAQLRTLHTILQGVPQLSDDVKNRIFKVVEEVD